MTTQTKYTPDTIREMSDDEFNLVAFSLFGKINGRRVRYAMRIAGKELRSANASASAETHGIDTFNDDLAALSDYETNRANDHGIAPPREDMEELRSYNAVYEIADERGFRAGSIIEMFKNILENAATGDQTSDEDLKVEAEMSGVSVDAIIKSRKANSQRNYQSTKETILRAVQVVDEVGTSEEAPSDFHELVMESIASAKKSAVKIAKDHNEAISNLVVLKAMEDAA